MVYAMGSGGTPQRQRKSVDPYQNQMPGALPESNTRLTPTTARASGLQDTDPTNGLNSTPVTTTATTSQVVNTNGLGWTINGLPGATTTTAPPLNVLRGTTWGQDPGDIRMERATEAEYLAEYYATVMNDPVKKMWLGRRAVLLGFAQYDKDSPFFVSPQDLAAGGAYQMWKWGGTVTTMNPTLNKLTPEQYIDAMYAQSGGDSGLNAYLAEMNKPRVSTSTSTSYASLTAEAAGAQADEVAMQNLGRMASDREMGAAGGTLNAMLKANPSTSTTTTTTDAEGNSSSSTTGSQGMSASEAVAAYEAKIRRSSEGMAYHVGTAMEQAMSLLDRGL